MHAFVFPGQGAQFVGMGKDLYDNVPLAKELFDRANEILGFPITDIMFAGTDEQLKQTKVTQPAIFLHSVILARSLGDAFKPDMAAGHSLGEFSALVAAGALGFEDGLKLVSKRAMADAESRRAESLTMAAIIALPGRKGRGGSRVLVDLAWSFRPITTARASSSFRARTRRSTRPVPS